MLATVDAATDEAGPPSAQGAPPADEAGLLAMALQPAVRPMPAIPGAPEVPGYEIISKIGAGASGEVWLADELDTGRIAALKILHRHGATGASAEVMQREIRMLARLVHPNLVLLHRAVTTCDGRHGLATEWIDGWPLDEWLEQHPDLPLASKLELFRGIVAGVAFLHDHGVIHRDLKPANLIVDTAGKPKIVDFGLARLHQEATATGSDGGSIGVSGTLHFMAPEQASNGQGSRAMPVDVYALGLILYRLLTGNWLRPTEATPAETLAIVLNPPALVFHEAARELPHDLQSILRQTLATDPARRYRHARDLEADLNRYAAKQPVSARKHTLVYLTATLLRRQAKRSMIAACLVLAGLTAGGVIYHRHRQVMERNEANLRYAYTLTSFTLGRLRDELRATVPTEKAAPRSSGGDLPGAEVAATPRLPVNENGQLDLRFYQAQLADIRAATSEGQAQHRAALTAIQSALDLYSQLAKEAPDDPHRLLDAAKARLSFARLLDKAGQSEASGVEARKTLRQLDRLASWPGFDPAPLPLLRCDALRLAAKDAHRTGDPAQAVELAREMLAIAESLPFGLLAQPEIEASPRLALAAADLASYAIAGDAAALVEARQDIDRATAACRLASERNPETASYARGLVHCLHATARLALHANSTEDLRPLFREATGLLIGEGYDVRPVSFSTIRSFCETATAWAGASIKHPDPELAQTALNLADELITYVRSHGGATVEIMVLRARLFLYESEFACRIQDHEKAAHAAYRAVRLLRSRQLRDPGRLSLALLTAAALHQARSLAHFPAADWNDGIYAPHLELLLKQLTERSAELTPEQQRELEALR